MSRQPRRPQQPQQGPSYSNLNEPVSPVTSLHGHGMQQQQGTSPLNPERQSANYYDPPRARLDGERSRSGESGSTASDSSGGIATTNDVLNGQIGAGYGPYSYAPVDNRPGSGRDSSLPPPSFHTNTSRPESSASHSSRAGSAIPPNAGGGPMRAAPVWTARDAEADDRLHNLSSNDKFSDRSCTTFSARGWLNVGALLFLVTGLIVLFAGYPIIQYYGKPAMARFGAFNVGGINATGQVPFINNLPGLIDASTPAAALTRTGFDGQKYVLTFSDEFNVDNRTFWPGDDPFWEAVDLHYWATGDYEWYDPDAVTTGGGNLIITIDEEPTRGFNFRSGMLQSWNKLCFTGGYIEVSVQLPGRDSISGFWPGAWTLGNLARAGYGATTDGTWPFSYDSCDVGTLVNQTNPAGTGPPAALNSGGSDYGGILSYQPGQRLSACTCRGEDHPGPNVGVGRGAPELDLIEAQVSYIDGGRLVGSVSQSAQFAPYDAGYLFRNASPQTIVYNRANTYLNDYIGGIYQQAVSAVTYTDPLTYELGGGGFSKYGWEAWPDRRDGYVTWSVGETASWTMTAAAVGPNALSGIGQRLVSEEPMAIILNLGMSSSFQSINWDELIFPGKMLVDYVRVYQREGFTNMGCDPPKMPTAAYINRHINAYTNQNFTTWAAAGNTNPKNSLVGC